MYYAYTFSVDFLCLMMSFYSYAKILKEVRVEFPEISYTTTHKKLITLQKKKKRRKE